MFQAALDSLTFMHVASHINIGTCARALDVLFSRVVLSRHVTMKARQNVRRVSRNKRNAHVFVCGSSACNQFLKIQRVLAVVTGTIFSASDYSGVCISWNLLELMVVTIEPTPDK